MLFYSKGKNFIIHSFTITSIKYPNFYKINSILNNISLNFFSKVSVKNTLHKKVLKIFLSIYKKIRNK
jgi:hypothetical protein